MSSFAFGKNNRLEKYELGGKCLNVAVEERDLGIIIQNDLKVSKQCSKVVRSPEIKFWG